MLDDATDLNIMIRTLNSRFGGSGAEQGTYVPLIDDFCRDFDCVGNNLNTGDKEHLRFLLKSIADMATNIQKQVQHMMDKLEGQ